MTDLHRLLTTPRHRRLLQLGLGAAWLAASLIVVVWVNSPSGAIALATVSGAIALIALKVVLVEGAALERLRTEVAHRGRRTDADIARVSALRLELDEHVDDHPTPALDDDSATQLESATRLVESSTARVAVHQQEIMALWDRLGAMRSPGASDATTPELFVHYHLPKTGGTTIRNLFLQNLEPGHTVLHLGRPTENIQSQPNDNAGIAALPTPDRERVRVVTGHTVDHATIELFAGRSIREVTVIRDPAERMISHYNFDCGMALQRNEPLPAFEEWYQARRPNQMTRFLVNRLAVRPDALISRLASFWFVGAVETMDEWLPDLCRAMSLPVDRRPPRENVTGVDHQKVMEVDDSLRARIAADHGDDQAFYEECHVKLFGPFAERLAARALANDSSR